jgi:hypothetical protein
MEELSEELQVQLQAKIVDLTNAFLGGCSKDRHNHVTQFKEPSVADFMAFTSSAHEVYPNDPPKFDDGPISQAEVAKLVLDQQVSLTQKLQESREALEARLNKLEGKTTDSDQSGVLPPPKFGMPQGFFKNQSSVSEASKLK